jgi:hypothetical protein
MNLVAPAEAKPDAGIVIFMKTALEVAVLALGVVAVELVVEVERIVQTQQRRVLYWWAI